MSYSHLNVQQLFDDLLKRFGDSSILRLKLREILEEDDRARRYAGPITPPRPISPARITARPASPVRAPASPTVRPRSPVQTRSVTRSPPRVENTESLQLSQLNANRSSDKNPAYTLEQLRQWARKYNVDTKGTKAELVTRLMPFAV
jgi:SAP domain